MKIKITSVSFFMTILLIVGCVKYKEVPRMDGDFMMNSGTGLSVEFPEFKNWLLKSKKNQLSALHDSRSFEDIFPQDEGISISQKQDGEDELQVKDLAYLLLEEEIRVFYNSTRLEKDRLINILIKKIRSR